MKKLTLVIAIASLVALLSVGTVFAQGETPYNPGNGGGGTGTGILGGTLHDYMMIALADGLGISPEEYIALRDAGSTYFQIGLDLGFDYPTLIEIRLAARLQSLQLALSDNAITQDQFDLFNDHFQSMPGMGGGRGNGGQGYGQGGGGGRGIGGGSCIYQNTLDN